MDRNEMDKKVIEQYQQDEKVMVLIFAQWCINHDLDPLEVYQQAYPGQKTNPLLLEAVEETVPENEADPIDNDILLQVLQVFGNDDLAFTVAEIIEQENKQ